MKKLAKVSAVILTTVLASGCASTGDIDMVNKRIDALEGKISQASSDAADAKSSAAAAEAAANRAASIAQDTNSKLDNMFKRSMMK
jgi:murein lipoprotein